MAWPVLAFVYLAACSVAGFLSFVVFPQPVYSGPQRISYMHLVDFEREVEQGAAGEWWLVEFYALWCTPCHDIFPVVADLSLKYSSDALRFAKIDVTKVCRGRCGCCWCVLWPLLMRADDGIRGVGLNRCVCFRRAPDRTTFISSFTTSINRPPPQKKVPVLAERYQVSTDGSAKQLPTFMLFHAGKEVLRLPELNDDGKVRTAPNLTRETLVKYFQLDNMEKNRDLLGGGGASAKAKGKGKGGRAGGGDAAAGVGGEKRALVVSS